MNEPPMVSLETLAAQAMGEVGGVENLIEHGRSTEGPSLVPGDLLGLSICLETPADLIADLEAALWSAPCIAALSVPRVDGARTNQPKSR
jgi:hypothetical protein